MRLQSSLVEGTDLELPAVNLLTAVRALEDQVRVVRVLSDTSEDVWKLSATGSVAARAKIESGLLERFDQTVELSAALRASAVLTSTVLSEAAAGVLWLRTRSKGMLRRSARPRDLSLVEGRACVSEKTCQRLGVAVRMGNKEKENVRGAAAAAASAAAFRFVISASFAATSDLSLVISLACKTCGLR